MGQKETQPGGDGLTIPKNKRGNNVFILIIWLKNNFHSNYELSSAYSWQQRHKRALPHAPWSCRKIFEYYREIKRFSDSSFKPLFWWQSVQFIYCAWVNIADKKIGKEEAQQFRGKLMSSKARHWYYRKGKWK